jgi:hypothetical protein
MEKLEADLFTSESRLVELTMKEGCWIKFCIALPRGIFLDNYFSQFLTPFIFITSLFRNLYSPDEAINNSFKALEIFLDVLERN